MKTVVFMYDFTGIMAAPWLDAGYRCVSFDGQHPTGITQEGNWFKVGAWFTGNREEDLTTITSFVREITSEGIHLVFGFPECTHLAVSGAAHFKKKLEEDPDIQDRAVRMAMLVEDVGNYFSCPWGAENPVSVLATKWRKADFSFHPYDYGGYLPEDDTHPLYPEYIKPRDAYPKKTCIWHGNGFTQPKPLPVLCSPGYSLQHSKLGGKSLKTKNIRSATPRGFAMAVFLHNQ